jgi:hypothetical protein
VSSNSVQADSPFLQRLYAYTQERFPILGHGLLIVSYYSSNSLLAQVLTRPSERLHYNVGSLFGAITLFCFFFHLRVFDEHKDFADDSVNYPDRVLQRGLITLADLRWLGAAAITIELVLAALWRPTGKPAALFAECVALAFSLLMLKEFFCGEWLRRHFLLYAASHMIIMPLLAMIVFGFTTGEYFWHAPGWFWWYSLVGFFVTFNWEISRKIRAPEDELPGVDTYSAIFGPFVAASLVLFIRVIDTSMVAAVGRHLNLSPLFFVAIILLFALTLFSYFSFIRNVTRRTAKQLEHTAGLYIIAFDAALAIELIRKCGVTFQW